MMKRIYFVCSLMAISGYVQSQNVGIGSPTPEQKLDVNGAIKIGNTSQNAAGTIRYNSGTFEGGNGSSWQVLEALPSKAIIVAQEPDTAFLKTKGFSFVRSLDIWDTSHINIPHNFPGTWGSIPVSGGTAPTVGTFSSESVYYNGRFIVYANNGFLYSYNASTQVWEQLPNASPLGDRTGYGMSLIGSDIYITGGWRFVVPNFVFYNTAAKYSLITNTWTSIANMPVGNAYHVTTVVGTDLYFINGASSFNGSAFVYSTKLYRYNTVSNSWSGDIATGATPVFLQQGDATGRNGKFLYSDFTLRAAGGANYMAMYEYDPVLHATTSITPALPFPNTSQMLFRRVNLLPTVSDKVIAACYFVDTTQVAYNPSNPGATTQSMLIMYEISTGTGITTQLSSCSMANNTVQLWQYAPTNGMVYVRTGNSNFVMFNRNGTGTCNTVLQRRGYWSYMKKN